MASLTVPGYTDDMDLQSDSGYGYEDGDIDIDLESTGGNMEADDDDDDDDDVVLEDVGIEGGDATLHDGADLDDFMGDEQGLQALGNDVEIADMGDKSDLQPGHSARHSPTQLSAVSVALQPNNTDGGDAEDDIIDYSSDELEEPPPMIKSPAQAGREAEFGDATEDSHNDNETYSNHQESERSANEGEGLVDQDESGLNLENDVEEIENEDKDVSGVAVQTWDESAPIEWQEQQEDDETYADIDYEEGQEGEADVTNNAEHVEESHTSADIGYAQEDHHEEGEAHSPRHSHRDDYEDTNPQQDEAARLDDEIEGHETDEGDEQSRLHSILLNYSGTDMFLFEPHPDQQPQMFLLSDERVATQSFHALFQACRTQLGNSIKHDTELGIQAKDLRRLEIYEDSIACASFCLKDLLDLYLALHRQDGNTNPEALYLKMLFRPRVISILGDLKKAVEQQVGFSGLESVDSFSQDNLQIKGTNQADGEEAEDGTWAEDGNSVLDLDQHEEEHDSGSNDAYGAQAVTANDELDAAASEDKPGAAAHLTSDVDDNSESKSKVDKSASQSENSSIAAAEAAGDFIDFADEDGDDTSNQTGQGSSNEPSSGSSTVQGDNTSLPTIKEDPANHPDTFDEEQLNYEFGETYEDNHDPDGNEYDKTESYAGDVNFDENGSMTLTGHLEVGPVDTSNGDNFLEGFDYVAGAGDDSTFDDLLGDLPPTDGGDDFTGANDFVDLDNGEGLASGSAVADRDAGQDASTSQSDKLGLDSPQGVKRSIDEVDGGVKTSGQLDDKRVRL